MWVKIGGGRHVGTKAIYKIKPLLPKISQVRIIVKLATDNPVMSSIDFYG
jgi:hypothetical protein